MSEITKGFEKLSKKQVPETSGEISTEDAYRKWGRRLRLIDDLLEENKAQEATEELTNLKNALAFLPDDSELKKELAFYEGIISRQNRDYDKAVEILEQLLAQEYINEGRSYVELARVYVRTGKYKRAKKLVEQALEINPKNVGWKLIYANIFEHLRKGNLALKVYNEILKLDRNHAPTLFRMGDLFYSQNKLASAVKSYDEAILLDPYNEIPWNNKGFAYFVAGQHREAIRCYDRALEINPRYGVAWYNKAYALHALELLEEAIKCYDRALEINPNDEVTWNNRGNALYNIGRRTRQKHYFRQALKYFMRAVEVNPDYEIAWNNVGNTLYYLGKYEKSLEYHDKAIDIKPDFYYAHHAKAEAYHKMGKFYNALENIDLSIELNPRYAASYVEKAVILTDLGRYEEAKRYFNLGITRQPGEGRFWIVYGQYHDKIGEHEKALKLYDEGARLYDRGARRSQREEHWAQKARILMEIGFFKDALEDIRRALVINPDHEESLLLKTELLIKLMNMKEALGTIEECVQTNPGEPRPWVMRGILLRDMDRYPEAEESLLKAIQIQEEKEDEKEEKDSHPYEELAELYLLLHDWDKLGEIAEKGLEIDENVNHRLWFIKGLMEKENKRYEKSIEYFTKAIEQNFWETDYYLNRGESYLEDGDYSMALFDFDQVLGDEPSHYMALYLKGLAYLKMGKTKSADLYFQKAIELEKDLPLAWVGRAEVSERRGDPKNEMKFRKIAESLGESDF